MNEDNDENSKKEPGAERRRDPLEPSWARMFLVAAGVEQWTPAEAAWLEAHPGFKKYENEMRRTCKESGIVKHLSESGKRAFATSPFWAPFQDHLGDLIEKMYPKKSGFADAVRKKRRKDSPPSID